MGKSTRWLWWPGLTVVMLLSTGFMCSVGNIFSGLNQPIPTEIVATATETAVVIPATPTATPVAGSILAEPISPTESMPNTVPLTIPDVNENLETESVDTGTVVSSTIRSEAVEADTIEPDTIETGLVETELVEPELVEPEIIDNPKPVFAMQYVPEEDLPVVKELGTNVVLQNFRDFGTTDDWLGYLDAAHSYEIQVIAWYWEPGWIFDKEQEAWSIDEKAVLFLETVQDHPALFAVYMVHEPYWNGCDECGYTTAQLQALYQQIKAVADVPLYAALGGLADWVTESDEKLFADGVCDYCDLWYYPFREGGLYNKEKTISVIEKEIGFAREKAPNSKIIWAMQAFAQGAPENDIRMWDEAEIRDLAALVYKADIYGISWYTWQFGDLYSDFLSKHPEYFPVVKEIADQYVTGELIQNNIELNSNLEEPTGVIKTDSYTYSLSIDITTDGTENSTQGITTDIDDSD